ncbi:MAG: peptidase and in kexin sedolisin, partial [Armatimonadetes bacterium]|nr:peptidase and in kexin sedolisin [Armatimonadota bacterium]
MPSFALAAQEADRTGMPVVEGFAARAADPAEAVAVETHILALLAVRHPDFSWTATETPGGWRAYRLQSAAVPPPPFPTLGAAWDTVREIAKDPRIVAAEPLLLARLPITSGSDAQREFKLWGTIKDERLQQIERESKALHWSLVKMNVCDDQGAGGAWAAWKAQPGNQNRVPGDGILIAHPDTGYTPHARLVPQLHARPGDPPGHHGRSFVEDTPEALTNGLDPMQDRSMGNQPGHGTHTASVIAAAPGDDGVPWGVAPGAKIIPLRVSSSVIHLSFGNVCSAFAEAIKREAHVISMSLGGPFGSGPLITAVREALDQGIIVVSAAGNHAPTTVFPARVAGVIACAASNVLTAPWRFSGLGSEVAITAPGELVWHDTRSHQGVDGLTSGSGTSYATANVAGLAALWLSFHGRDALAAKYGLPGIPFAFRMCLQESANKQPKFLRQGKGGFGAGVVDAEALLLETLPHQEEVKRVRQEILSQDPSGIVGFPINTWWIILTLPTLAADGAAIPDRQVDLDDRAERINRFLTDLVGPLENLDMAEIAALAASDRALQRAFARVAQGDRTAVSAAAVRRYLLRPSRPLSESLRGRLVTARDAARGQWLKLHPALSPGAAPSVPAPSAGEYPLSPPPTRRLRAYAFDPSLATRSSDAA